MTPRKEGGRAKHGQKDIRRRGNQAGERIGKHPNNSSCSSQSCSAPLCSSLVLSVPFNSFYSSFTLFLRSMCHSSTQFCYRQAVTFRLRSFLFCIPPSSSALTLYVVPTYTVSFFHATLFLFVNFFSPLTLCSFLLSISSNSLSCYYIPLCISLLYSVLFPPLPPLFPIYSVQTNSSLLIIPIDRPSTPFRLPFHPITLCPVPSLSVSPCFPFVQSSRLYLFLISSFHSFICSFLFPLFPSLFFP